jgi:hypothetical protein
LASYLCFPFNILLDCLEGFPLRISTYIVDFLIIGGSVRS